MFSNIFGFLRFLDVRSKQNRCFLCLIFAKFSFFASIDQKNILKVYKYLAISCIHKDNLKRLSNLVTPMVVGFTDDISFYSPPHFFLHGKTGEQ